MFHQIAIMFTACLPVAAAQVTSNSSTVELGSIFSWALLGSDLQEILFEFLLCAALVFMSGLVLRKTNVATRKQGSKLLKGKPSNNNTVKNAMAMASASTSAESGSEEPEDEAVADIDEYNRRMQGVASRGDLEGCVALCKEMKDNCVQPSEATFGVLLSACMKAGDVARLRALLLEIGSRCSAEAFGQCQSYVGSLVAADRCAEAQDLLEDLAKVAKVDGEVCQLMLKACVKTCDKEAVRRALSFMRVQNVKPNVVDALESASPAMNRVVCDWLVASRAAREAGAEQQQQPAASGAGKAADVAAAGAGGWRDASAAAQAADADASGNVSARLAQFIDLNGLDSGCARMLRRLPTPQFLIEVDASRGTASGKVVHTVLRSKHFPQEMWAAYPTGAQLRQRQAAFVELNKLDRRCMQTLERLSEAALRRLMDAEFLVKADPSKGSASAKVVGHVLRITRSP
eukprot:TRINITY_DN17765_c0_g1_i3.p1 TRINITY_DN17765_c0_g1~~TRINITY_DN17765_c0_g1_i3.p1  ORF type:complete len:460 (+),score=143.33 TRINITY_DN17765_c0_g1_i3:110-1489(+)